MRRFYLGSLLAIPAVAVMLATIPGCPNKEPSKKEPPKKESSSKEVPDGTKQATSTGKGGKAFVVTNTGGTIKGRVVYDGTPPKMPEIKGIQEHNDPKEKAACHAGPDYTHKQQTWIVGKDNGVANVLVTLEPPEGKFFALDKDEAEKYKDKDAVIDQPFCVFEPHVVAAFAAYRDKDGKLHETGAKLVIKNSGDISHNTKSDGDGKRDKFNTAAPPKKTETVGIDYSPKRILDIACDKHNWMSAKLATLDHPFFAVTDKDGNFEIKNVPTGVELTIKTWHEDAPDVTDKVDAKSSGVTEVKELKIKSKAS